MVIFIQGSNISPTKRCLSPRAHKPTLRNRATWLYARGIPYLVWFFAPTAFRVGSGSVSFSEWASYAEDMKVLWQGEFSMGVLSIDRFFEWTRCIQ